jgi:hypothetical protein
VTWLAAARETWPICEELKLPAEHRSVREDASEDELRQVAAAMLRDWAERYGG